MPITKSAIKKMHKDRKKTLLNKIWRERLKTAIKKTRKNRTITAMREAFSLIDKAVKKHIIQGNTASRIKSNLSRITKKT